MMGVTFLVPVRNGAATLRASLESILREVAAADACELILVDDGSTDAGVEGALAETSTSPVPVRVLRGQGDGAAAALNRGLAAARFEVVAQVDQDVVLEPGWLAQLVACLDADDVAAVQGQYVTDPRASLFSRIMGRDLQQRYASVGADTTHVCTGNAVYRTSALRSVGGFDETLGYGYDNDMSYRLRRAGYRLRYCQAAQSTHHWREGLAGYIVQQYGFGYGRLNVLSRHRTRLAGDSVSPAMMMMHPVATAAALALLVLALGLEEGRAWALVGGAGLLAGLAGERAVAGIQSARTTRDWAPLLFPIVHLLRDVTWVCATVAWSLRRMLGTADHPQHSMRPRRLAPVTRRAVAMPDGATARSAHADSPALRARRPSGAV